MRHFKEYVSALSEKVDVIHIHGTENGTTLAALQCVDVDKTVISIQGLIHIIYETYMRDFHFDKPNNLITSLFPKFYFTKKALKLMKTNASREIQSLEMAKNIIGRTDWDRACTMSINPKVNYYYCNEILRKVFYESRKWNIELIEKHSIFLTQVTSPIKGFDKFLMAFSLVVKEFPDSKVYIASGVFEKRQGFKGKIFNNIVEWNSEINYLIDKYNLRNNIVFLGGLDEEEMVANYLKANVFVSPSRMENSSNSVCEAKMLGTPCISSCVGGCVSNLIDHGKDGFLYDFSEYRMLAYYIKKIFNDSVLACELSKNAIISGGKYNNREDNRRYINEIYNSIKRRE